MHACWREWVRKGCDAYVMLVSDVNVAKLKSLEQPVTWNLPKTTSSAEKALPVKPRRW